MAAGGNAAREVKRGPVALTFAVFAAAGWVSQAGLALEGGQAHADGGRPPAGNFQAITDGQRRAIGRALAYLKRTQHADGSWIARPGHGRRYAVAMTALAGQAFLAGGHLPGRGAYGTAVQRAIGYLLRQQDASGLIAVASLSGGRPMYGHGFATLFLAQVYGMTSDSARHQRIRQVLTRAVALTASCQSRDGGWYYQPRSTADEGSVTITQVQGLRAARNVGIPVPYATIKRAIGYIHRSQGSDGSVHYSVRHAKRGSGSPALTAAGLEVLYSAGEYSSRQAEKALAYIRGVLDARTAHGHQTYFRFYACQGLFQAGEETYRRYWPRLRAAIVAEQRADGSWQGDHVGPVYGAALYAIVLQIPYRYLPIYQR